MESLANNVIAEPAAAQYPPTVYRAAFEDYLWPLLMLDLRGEIIALNKAMRREFGVLESDWIGRSISALFLDPADFRDFQIAQFDSLRRENGQILCTRFGGDGTREQPVELTCVSQFRWTDEQRVYVVEARVPSNQSDAAVALRASEQRFRDFIAATSDFLWELDEELRFSYLSPRYAEITGVARDKLIGKTRRQVPLPSLRAHEWNEHLDSIESHEPVREFVFRRQRPDGSLVWLSISGMPVFDEAGKFTGYRGTGQDVTDRVNAELAMRESEERFRQFADMAADFFWETDLQHFYTRATGNLGRLLGLEGEHMIGKSRVEQLLRLDIDSKKLAHHLRQLQAFEPFQDFQIGVRLADGTERRVVTSGMPFYDDDGECLGWRGVGRDITSEWDLARKLSYQATHDGLTGLVNREEFERLVERAIEDLKGSGMEHSLCYLDLDQFKVLNDTCGHTAGDALLRRVAQVLQESVRSSDTVARLGGDEFGILLERCPLETASEIAEIVRKNLSSIQFFWEGSPFRTAASLGIVPILGGSDDAQRVLSGADAACYAAKDAGRNRIYMVQQDDAEISRRHGEMRWVSRIHDALDHDRFQLFYQRIVPLQPAPHRGAHLELLVRMEETDGSLVPPGAFLPAAERYGLAPKIDRWVVEKALQWLDSDPSLRDKVDLCAINLSGHSISDAEFLTFLKSKLEEHPNLASCVCFEITETAAVSHLSVATVFIEKLRELGARFALDDFGTGLSSFAYLKNLPVDYLKIDGLFVRDIVDDPVDYAMVRCIAEMGTVMGKRTIAEFVENDAILQRLKAIGVDYAQGYGVGMPCKLALFADEV